MVADGQFSGNSAIWNGTTIDGNAFYGSDPHESTATWSYGNLSDTKSYLVNVTLGGNNTTAEIVSGGSDCFTWVGQVVDVGVAATKGPYHVDFQEQGLPSGTSWSITTDSSTKTGTVVNGTSTIRYSLANGTYSYSAGAVAGFIGPSASSYTVNGGSVFIRVIFHQILYPVSFNETGIPTSYQTWWVLVTNSSQGISENLSAYTPLGNLFSLGNGTFNYSAGEIGLYLAKPPTGTFVVNGGPLTVTVTFVPPPLYAVTFQEFGLPPGTTWGGSTSTNFGVFSNSTSNASFTLELPNGTGYTDYISPTQVAGYAAPDYLYFQVLGAAVTYDINYSEQFGVTLAETGLPTGTYWEAGLTSATTNLYASADTPWLNFTVSNGTYNFSVQPVWSFTATPGTGSVTVNGANVTVAIVFTAAPEYALTFEALGLASGALWAIELGLPNGTFVTHNATTTTIGFSEPNGSYEYTPVATGYLATPEYGYADIVGANVTVWLNFTKVYAVTFNETGLPSGTYWYVYFAYQYVGGYGSSAGIYIGNGSYTYQTFDISYYTPSTTGGTINVSGANVYVSIVYNSSTYPTVSVTFTESGLPASSNWTVELNDWEESSTATSIVFTEPNGTFDFYVPSVLGYDSTPTYGSVNVSGAPVTQAIVFAPPAGSYVVNFAESNLPSGSTWYINITGQSPMEATVSGSTGTSLGLSLPNGTYSFTAATGNPDWATDASGSFTVNGADLNLSVPFTSTLSGRYTVQFTETGLPSGSTWYVNVTGYPGLVATVSGTSGTSVSILLTNGTYTYGAATSAAGWTTPSSGSTVVNGANVNVSVPFSSNKPYTVTFTETGLPIGVTWYVNISGEPSLSTTVGSSSGTQLSISLVNGSYSFSAASNSKNWTASGSSFSVAGSAVNLTVKFGPPGSTSSSGGFGSFWIWIVIGAIVAGLLLLILVAGRRRKKEPPTTAAPAGTTTPASPTGGTAGPPSPPTNP